jgi:hypothetical protein
MITLSEEQAELFDQFWQAYPKKRSKGQAKRTWVKLDPDESLLTKMLKTIAKARRSNDWLQANGQYIPHPSTWLNNEGWEDEMSVEDDAGRIDPNYKDPVIIEMDALREGKG